MRNIFSGTYEQVEESISPSFIDNSLNTVKAFKGFKLFAFIVMFIGAATYALYGVSIYMGNNMEHAVGGLDVHNEFIPFLSSVWYANLQAVPITIGVFATIWFSDRNRIKGHYIYYLFLMIFMIFFGLMALKVFQLMVSFFILRMIYTVLFIATFIYSIWQGYQNAIHMVYGRQKKRSAIVEWVSGKSKEILTVLAIIGGLYFVIKAVFEPAVNMERRIIGSLVDFLPLAIVLINFAFIYYIGVVIRSYYVHKYSEEFRLKFEYDKEEWYGPKHR